MESPFQNMLQSALREDKMLKGHEMTATQVFPQNSYHDQKQLGSKMVYKM